MLALGATLLAIGVPSMPTASPRSWLYVGIGFCVVGSLMAIASVVHILTALDPANNLTPILPDTYPNLPNTALYSRLRSHPAILAAIHRRTTRHPAWSRLGIDR